MVITDVQVNLTGFVDPEDISRIQAACQRGDMFIVHNDDNSMIAYFPDTLTSIQKVYGMDDIGARFRNANEMIMNLKLAMFAHNKVYIPCSILPDNTEAIPIHRTVKTGSLPNASDESNQP